MSGSESASGASHGPYSLESAQAAIWPASGVWISDDVLEGLARQAGDADDRGTLAPAAIAALRAAGYFKLAIPQDLGGGGAGLLVCAAVQRRLALADPALAIATNMHLFSMGMAAEHWLRQQDACGLLLKAIAEQNRVVASAFAEPGLGGNLLRSMVRARRVAGGYVASGVKSPCSLAAECDLVCFQMMADPPEPRGLMMALLPAQAPGIAVERSWDALGMRASGSDTLRFEQCFVPDNLIFHRSEPGSQDDEVFAAGLVWFCVTTTATYLGVADAAVNALRQGLAQVAPQRHAVRAQSASVQQRLGEIVAATLALAASCAGVAQRLDSREHAARSLLPLAVAVRHSALDVCVRAVEGSAELLGGRSYQRTHLLARLWRDVQGLHFHPPNRVLARHLLGRWALGLPFAFELPDEPA